MVLHTFQSSVYIFVCTSSYIIYKDVSLMHVYEQNNIISLVVCFRCFTAALTNQEHIILWNHKVYRVSHSYGFIIICLHGTYGAFMYVWMHSKGITAFMRIPLYLKILGVLQLCTFFLRDKGFRFRMNCSVNIKQFLFFK